MRSIRIPEIPQPESIHISASDERLELSYRLRLSTLRTFEQWILASLVIAAGISAIIALFTDFHILFGLTAAASALPIYVCITHFVNRWYISVDCQDILVDSGPLPTGVAKLFSLDDIQYVYCSEAEPPEYRLMARLADGRVVKVVGGLTAEGATFIRENIEANLPHDDIAEQNYSPEREALSA